MSRFIAARVLRGLLVIIGVTMVVFFVTRVIADPAVVMLPDDSSAETIETFRASLGYDRAIPVQFVEFTRDAATLDFGDSLMQRRPALEIVAERFPRSIVLAVSSLALAVMLSILLGVLGALRPGSWVDHATSTTALLGLSMPQFWLGLLLVFAFGVHLGWFPTSGFGGIEHMVLPAVALALPAAGRLTLITRSSMIEELSRSYVTTARSKGLGSSYIIRRHVLRNAAVPLVTLTGWELVRALAGYTIVVEAVFAYPGIGSLALDSVDRQDLPVIQATVFAVAVVVVVVNILIDVLYVRVDPRIKL